VSGHVRLRPDATWRRMYSGCRGMLTDPSNDSWLQSMESPHLPSTATGYPIAAPETVLYLQVAALWNVKGDTKKRRIRSVLSWLQPPAQLPPDMDAALGLPGVFNGGVGFNVQIWRQEVSIQPRS
jgi:hypothetical protein